MVGVIRLRPCGLRRDKEYLKSSAIFSRTEPHARAKARSEPEQSDGTHQQANVLPDARNVMSADGKSNHSFFDEAKKMIKAKRKSISGKIQDFLNCCLLFAVIAPKFGQKNGRGCFNCSENISQAQMVAD